MKNATFGFTFGQNTAQRSARKTPQPRPRSASSRLTPQPAPARRSKSRTPANSSIEKAASSHRSSSVVSVMKQTKEANGSMFVTPTITRKRKRIGTIQTVEENGRDESEKGDEAHLPLSAGPKTNQTPQRRQSTPRTGIGKIVEKENQGPTGRNSGKKSLPSPTQENAEPGADELNAANVDKTASALEDVTTQTPSRLEAGQIRSAEEIDGEDGSETPMTNSIEARYIPRKSFQNIGKLNLTGAKPTNKKVDEEKVKKSKKGTKSTASAQPKIPTPSSPQAESSSSKAAAKSIFSANQRVRRGKLAAVDSEDHSHTTALSRSKQTAPVFPQSRETIDTNAPMTRTDDSHEADNLAVVSGSMQTDAIESPTNQMKPPLRPSTQAPVAVMTASASKLAGPEHFSPAAQDSIQSSSFMLRVGDTLANSPADWRPATDSLNLDNQYSTSPPHPPQKTAPTKKRKALPPPSPDPSRHSSPEPSQPARKRTRPSPADSVPITIYRLSQPLRPITHDPDSSSDSEDLPTHSSATTSSTYKPSNTPNAIDVLTQVTTELLDARATALDTQAQAAARRRKNIKQRRTLERQRNTVLQFAEEVSAQLFALTAAVDAHGVLGARLRALQREKVRLREELVGVRKRREEVGVETDEVRAGHVGRMERLRAERTIREGVVDVDVAVRRGREAERRKGDDEEDGVEGGREGRMGSGGMARRLGDVVSARTEEGGLLAVVKRFNERLEEAADILEG
ncbi:MAG: hypothetical protein M1821_009696 [Bathelium mastoideum]|nr:MAG: hypothetical protein M1821_009696 [Bathelium mastoideum]